MSLLQNETFTLSQFGVVYQIQLVIQSDVKHELLENADEIILCPSEFIKEIFIRHLDISVILFFKTQFSLRWSYLDS